uniref:Cysteine/serine-rich nuclear protein N-terminal domain-containing protein n=1 Tax=Acrobeloides nanus TaxID=290746 RepID=A0A914ECK5_9BILA
MQKSYLDQSFDAFNISTTSVLMHNFQGSSKSRSDEEPSTKRQRLLCRTKKIELSEDEVNSSQLLLQQHQTLPTTSSGKFSTVSVSNVSNIDLRNMVTNSLPLETKSPQVNMLQNNESQLFSPGMRRNSNSQISFSTVEIFYFERAQGFSTIPSHGDIALGMGEKHYLQQNFSLSDFNSSQAKRKQSSPRRNPPRGPSKFRIQAEKKSTQNSQESIENCQLETINEMEEPTEAVSVTPFVTTPMDDEPRVENEKKPANKNVDDNSSSSSESEVEDECCEEDEVFHDVNLLQPLSNKNRKLLLKEAGVRINQNEKFECRNIRRSRLTCGCSCEDGICLPET